MPTDPHDTPKAQAELFEHIMEGALSPRHLPPAYEFRPGALLHAGEDEHGRRIGLILLQRSDDGSWKAHPFLMDEEDPVERKGERYAVIWGARSPYATADSPTSGRIQVIINELVVITPEQAMKLELASTRAANITDIPPLPHIMGTGRIHALIQERFDKERESLENEVTEAIKDVLKD